MQAEAHSSVGTTRSVFISITVKRARFVSDRVVALSYSFYDMLVFCSLEIAMILLYRASKTYIRVHGLVCYGQRLPSRLLYCRCVIFAQEGPYVCYCVDSTVSIVRNL